MTFERKAKGGRLRISQELEALIICLARENSRWGYGKIEGELLKLGFTVSASSVRNVLNRHAILPVPVSHLGKQSLSEFSAALLSGPDNQIGSAGDANGREADG